MEKILLNEGELSPFTSVFTMVARSSSVSASCWKTSPITLATNLLPMAVSRSGRNAWTTSSWWMHLPMGAEERLVSISSYYNPLFFLIPAFSMATLHLGKRLFYFSNNIMAKGFTIFSNNIMAKGFLFLAITSWQKAFLFLVHFAHGYIFSKCTRRSCRQWRTGQREHSKVC